MWITPDARKMLKLLATEMDKHQEDLLREGANDLLAKYGKPRIA
jgi:translation initiation factor 2 alpha subunit (eIF-2alpha)